MGIVHHWGKGGAFTSSKNILHIAKYSPWGLRLFSVVTGDVHVDIPRLVYTYSVELLYLGASFVRLMFGLISDPCNVECIVGVKRGYAL